MAECRSCRAVIDWAALPDGKAMPVDRASADDPSGSLAVRRLGDGTLAVRYLKRGEEPRDGEHRAISHFATCQDADDWRSRSERLRLSQQQGPPPSPHDAYKALLKMMAAHLDCKLERVGSCVYCKEHGTRLGQGMLPGEKEKAQIRAECERLGVPAGSAGDGP